MDRVGISGFAGLGAFDGRTAFGESPAVILAVTTCANPQKKGHKHAIGYALRFGGSGPPVAWSSRGSEP